MLRLIREKPMVTPFSKANISLELFQTRVKIFCLLCETKSFTKTAKRLKISQSVVSRTIAEMEEDLKVSLIDHSVRPIRATTAGSALYHFLAEELARFDEQLGLLRVNNALLSPMRVGFVESIARTMSWPVIEKIRKRYSTVSVLTGISTYLLQLLDHEVIDAAIVPDPFTNRNDLDRYFIFREPSIIILPKGTSLPENLTWERLQYSGLPIVQYNNQNSGGKLQEKFFSKLGLNFVYRFEVDINALLLDYVANGAGWALTRPTTLLQHPSLAKQVDVRPMPTPVASREVYVIARKNRHTELASHLARHACEYFRTTIAPEMVKITPWVAPYLYTAGENPSDRIPIYKNVRAPDSENVFVL